MATLIELRNLLNSSDLRNKVEAAVIISADKVMRGDDNVAPFSQTAGDHDIRVTWAKEAFTNPGSEARKFLMSVIASNEAAALSAIIAASDTDIKDNVDEAVDLMAGVSV